MPITTKIIKPCEGWLHNANSYQLENDHNIDMSICRIHTIDYYSYIIRNKYICRFNCCIKSKVWKRNPSCLKSQWESRIDKGWRFVKNTAGSRIRRRTQEVLKLFLHYKANQTANFLTHKTTVPNKSVTEKICLYTTKWATRINADTFWRKMDYLWRFKGH